MYQGKELQEELGLGTFDFHARMYDPAIGRTFQQDPHADSYFDLSPYSWVANNPMGNTDPTGMDISNGAGKHGGDLYTGADAQNLFRQLQTANGGGGGERKYSAVGIGEGSAFNASLRGENPYEVEETPVKHHNYWRNNQAELLSKIDNEYIKEGLQFFFDYFVGDDPGIPGIGAVSRSIPNLAIQATKARRGVYDGVRSASKYLQEQGVPRAYRKQILQSFEIETISLRTAGNATFGLRFYGGVANQSGRYLFPTFTNYTNRVGLALPPSWNRMSGISQFQISPGSRYIFGRAASQGGIYSGGSYQMYINNLINLIK